MPQKKLVLRLDDSSTNEVIIYGLIIATREYKVVAFINSILETPLQHVQDYNYTNSKGTEKVLYPIFASDEKNVWFISNRTNEVYLFPEIKPFNAILVLYAEADDSWVELLKDYSAISLMQTLPQKFYDKILYFVESMM